MKQIQSDRHSSDASLLAVKAASRVASPLTEPARALRRNRRFVARRAQQGVKQVLVLGAAPDQAQVQSLREISALKFQVEHQSLKLREMRMAWMGLWYSFTPFI
ncbi:MAG: hypothetical protein EBU88_20140 [Acidobacteria bacterium]|nr:hypothetical protein [Acidobacteriota bacterium]